MNNTMKYKIWSIEHTAWWAPGASGYVRKWKDAGIFEQDRAFLIVKGANRALGMSLSDKPDEALVPVEDGKDE